jgi:hypothetical protein
VLAAAGVGASALVAFTLGEPLRIASPLPSKTASFAGMEPFGLEGSSLIE